MPRVLGDRSVEWLEQVPFFMRTDQTLEAKAAAVGPEYDILDAQLDRLEENLIASTATDLLYVFEEMVGLTVDPPDLTVEQRRAAVVALHAQLTLTGSATDMIAGIQRILGAGWTLLTHDPTDGTSPAADNFVIRIPYVAGSAGAAVAERLIGLLVPATVILNVTYGEGFILDHSLLDDDLL